MSTTTASVKPTNRFLEVTQRYAHHLPCTPAGTTRSRSEALAHLSGNVSAVLFLEGRPQFKRRKLDASATKADTSIPWEESKNETKMAEEETGRQTKTETTKATSSLSDEVLIEQDMLRQKEELSSITKEILELEDTKKQVLQEVVDVIASYQFGLRTIHALTDLSAAPDAIMPGNF